MIAVRKSIVLMPLLMASVGGVVAATAAADFGPPTLLSYSPREQADRVGSSALSADGRWLVYSGSLDGVAGIFRRDLASGATDIVAGGDAYTNTVTAAQDARLPSISADGRYVSFTTATALDPADDTNTAADVYLRDMDDPSGAYTLVSARDGSAAGLDYTNAAGAGSAAGRTAISADGRRVAFVTQDGSDLAGQGTPAGQVAVRDLDTRRTTLVSSARDSTTGAMTGQAVPDGAVTATATGDGRPVMVAALSADGSTVAWLGAHIDRQAPTLSDEATEPGGGDSYDEPLWRRIADGLGAPTRRIIGGGDPLAPGCPADGTLADVACQGPYPDLTLNANSSAGFTGGWVTQPGLIDAVPSISADGRTVALIGTPPIAPANQRTVNGDVFLVDMRDGLTRRQAVQRLTEELSTSDVLGIFDAAIAPNGRRVAFATSRTDFALTPPFLTGGVPSQAGGLLELYFVDLDGQSLRRVSTTIDGAPAGLMGARGGPVVGASPSFDATGRLLAFDSTADNLVPGDTNNAKDAFLLTDSAPPAGVPGRTEISPAPLGPQIQRAWTWALRAVAQKDGTVRLDADVPGAGALKATVRATVPVTRHVRVRKHGGGHRTVTRRVLAQRQVALKSARPRAGGLTRLSLKVSRSYISLVRATGGLYATATVTFTAPGRRTLRSTLDVRFRIVPARTAKKKTTKPVRKTKTTKKAAAR
jgi:Tol biopolymer transport system component